MQLYRRTRGVKEQLIKRREEGEMESGFAKIHLTCNTNTILLNLSILTQCSFLSRFSCDVYLTGWVGFGWLVWFLVCYGLFFLRGWLVFGLWGFCGGGFGGVFCWVFFKIISKYNSKRFTQSTSQPHGLSFNYACLF